jgi:beta-N-acetylhexosaminidase
MNRWWRARDPAAAAAKGDTMIDHNLSDRQRAGQRMMVGFDGTALDDTLKSYIDRIKVGGLILFSRNIVAPDQVAELCAKAQEYAARCGQPPLFIGIDQEGGVVARLKAPFTQFKGNPFMTSPQDAIDFAGTTARELARIGVNMNMAPVLDALPPEGPSVMRDRAFKGDPQQVARMGTTVIAHLQKGGVMAVAKHFPGIGRTTLDSHDDLPDLDVDAATLETTDMLPFRSAIDAQVAGIMLAHIRYRGLDPRWPASLSPAIAQTLLRDRMGFPGLVITDDLDMGALAKHFPISVIVEQCVRAWVDILLICHAGPKIQQAHDHLLSLCKNDARLQRREEESLQRILGAKQSFLDGV